MTRTRILSAILNLSALSISCLAQGPTSLSVAHSINVDILDRDGNSIRSLTKESLLKVSGKPVSITEAHYSSTPRRIVVLLDMSGSMETGNAGRKWQIARDLVDELLSETPPSVSVALLTFSVHVHERFGFQSGREAIVQWLKERAVHEQMEKKEQRTALFDALLEALIMLKPVHDGDSIFAITDGGDNVSQTTSKFVRSALLGSGVRLFSFYFDELPPGGSESDAEERFLEMIDDSGGFVFSAVGHHGSDQPSWHVDFFPEQNSGQRLKTVVHQLTILVNQYWTLSFEVPRSNKDAKIAFAVVDGTGKSRKGVSFVCPRVLLAGR